MAGCDTTWRLFGIGKGVALRKLNTAPTFKQMAEVHCGKESRDDIVSAGEMARSTVWRGPGCFALPTVPQEGIGKQHNCAAAQSASHIGSSVLPQRSGVFASAAVDGERRRSGPRRMGLTTSAETP